jgi:hypothetical protein
MALKWSRELNDLTEMNGAMALKWSRALSGTLGFQPATRSKLDDTEDQDEKVGIEGIPMRSGFCDFSRVKSSISAFVSEKVIGIDHLINCF